MLEPRKIVINTGPLLAIVAAVDDLSVLQLLYHDVFVPFEVCQEVLAAGSNGFAVTQFENATWLRKQSSPIHLPSLLKNSLDREEASVIQLALNQKIQTVCLDEIAGRRIASLSGLAVTGSIGILLRAKKEGMPLSMTDAIRKMREKGTWLGERLIAAALREAGESV
jgi:predicted nucleic acid-binding protein